MVVVVVVVVVCGCSSCGCSSSRCSSIVVAVVRFCLYILAVIFAPSWWENQLKVIY